MKKEKKKYGWQAKGIIIAFALVVVLLIAESYAWMLISKTSTTVNKITAGSLDLILDDSTSDGIHLENVVPMSYQQGIQTTAYTFKLKNNATTKVDYTISLEDFYDDITIPPEGKIADSKIRYILLKDDEESSATNSKLLSEGRNIETGKIDGTTEISYTLYIWIDSQAGVEVNSQVFNARLNITAEQAVPTYTVSGALTDGSGNPVNGGTVVAFSDPKYAEVNADGTFTLNDLPIGAHTIYYVPGKTVSELLEKTQEEIESIEGSGKTSLNTNSSAPALTFSNGYSATGVSVEKENEAIKYSNSNILMAYKYDYDPTNNPTGCITGEEESCEQIPVKKSVSLLPGTIIKYKVNDTTEKYFHVLHDDGDKVTLQQRENTVNDVEWYSAANDNTKGPTTILASLESVTSNWTNVNNLTYRAGTTVLYENQYTGCTATAGTVLTCSSNKYTLGEKNVKARMITGQETAALECKNGTSQSCPSWMNNYLYQSTSNGGTQVAKDSNGKDTYGYWTMSANASNSEKPWFVLYNGSINGSNYTRTTNYGARAVVEINK